VLALVEPDHQTRHSHANFLLYYLHVGSNALCALKGLGVLEAILAKVNQSASPDDHRFVFRSGTGDELVYDVGFKYYYY
jgi:hypothetical protein